MIFFDSLLLSLAFLMACGKKPKLETCTFCTLIDIEAPEAEIKMVCGDKIIDVP
ncbi:hypothetical protein [[Limnothrix rosea] IAM M-220]|uniref:hypothetical protein n=1 Tax=[Limnothrix rosea] IAM M-220 TaxID=454133 RepID=UPI0015C53E6F|nr:hypothetical protein [[Limnothrix rosea] IAM M-220]